MRSDESFSLAFACAEAKAPTEGGWLMLSITLPHLSLASSLASDVTSPKVSSGLQVRATYGKSALAHLVLKHISLIHY
jgi:hypothetical protein